MRGPVGSLARPEAVSQFEALDAGEGVVVYVEEALPRRALDGAIDFQFGLLGRCTAIVGPSA